MLPLPDRKYVELYRIASDLELDQYIRDEWHGDKSFLIHPTEQKKKRSISLAFWRK